MQFPSGETRDLATRGTGVPPPKGERSAQFAHDPVRIPHEVRRICGRQRSAFSFSAADSAESMSQSISARCSRSARLEETEIALVNRENYIVFQPLLPEVISGLG